MRWTETGLTVMLMRSRSANRWLTHILMSSFRRCSSGSFSIRVRVAFDQRRSITSANMAWAYISSCFSMTSTPSLIFFIPLGMT